MFFPYFLYFCPFPQHIFKFGNFVNIGTECSTPLIRSFDIGVKLGHLLETLLPANETDAIAQPNAIPT